MAHYAKVNNGLVEQVIVAEEEFFDTFVDNSPGDWIQTSYNTKGGINSKGGDPLRKNYASVGYAYDATRDAFIPPQRFPTWTLNEDTCQWESPVAYPTTGRHTWNEETTSWDEVTE